MKMTGEIRRAVEEALKERPTKSNLVEPTNTKSNPVQPKEEERKYKLKTLLSIERKPIQSLKTGFFCDALYFTTISANGKTIVVTSDKQCYVDWGKDEDGNPNNEIKSVFRLPYRYSFEIDVLDSNFSISAVDLWLHGNPKIKTIKELFEIIFNNNQKFMYYPDINAHRYVALDIISTYYMPLFEAKGRTLIVSEKGSGKTRQCILYKLQSLNAIMSSDISKSAFFRIMESTCVTLIIDDFDDIQDEQKRDVLQHYKTGYKQGNKAIRTGEKARKIDAFRNYGHCCMNNTMGLDEISQDRTIQLPILKTDREDVTKNDINEQSPSWKYLRDNLFWSALTYYKDVQQAYTSVQSKLKARQFEISRPVLAIASLIDLKLKEDVEDWLKESFEETSQIDFETDWTFLGVVQFKDKKGGDNIILTDITEEVASKTEDRQSHTYNTKKRGIATFLGKFFKNTPVFKPVTVNGRRHIKLVSTKRFDSYIKMKGWDKVILGEAKTPNQKSIFFQIEKDYSGKCSYCGGNNKWINYRDQDGNHICQECYVVETKK